MRKSASMVNEPMVNESSFRSLPMNNEPMVNESSFRSLPMNNGPMKIRSCDERRKLASDAEVESGADRLVQKLHAPECRTFFCKVMYYLPTDEREGLLERAMSRGINSPKKWFTVAAKRALYRRGVF